MPVRVAYSLEYRRVREKLSPATKRLVDLVEDEIARDPELGHHRREVRDGELFDYSADDLIIRYRRVSDELVEFQRLLYLPDPTL